MARVFDKFAGRFRENGVIQGVAGEVQNPDLVGRTGLFRGGSIPNPVASRSEDLPFLERRSGQAAISAAALAGGVTVAEKIGLLDKAKDFIGEFDLGFDFNFGDVLPGGDPFITREIENITSGGPVGPVSVSQLPAVVGIEEVIIKTWSTGTAQFAMSSKGKRFVLRRAIDGSLVWKRIKTGKPIIIGKAATKKNRAKIIRALNSFNITVKPIVATKSKSGKVGVAK